MVTTSESHTVSTAVPEQKDPLLKILAADPHQTFTVDELLKALKLPAAKDPQKQAQAAEEITAGLRRLIEAGRVVEVEAGAYKTRLFFDKEESIEHAFIGGMGNTRYRFRSPIFRLNIGVLSLFFIRDPRAGDWMVTIRDSTIGRDYGLTRRLRDGAYVFGSRPAESGESHYLQIDGKYISKDHVTTTLAGEEVTVEDHKTLHGTRLDLLTKEGLRRYIEAAQALLKSTDPKDHYDSLKRGRFALEQLLQHHQNFETSFFGAVVDWILLGGRQTASKA